MAKPAAPKPKPAKAAVPDQPAFETFSRDILPIPDPKHVGLTTYDAKDPDTKYPPIRTLRPSKGAPNVLIVLCSPSRQALLTGRSTGYRSPFEFTGTLFRVTVDLSGKLIPDTDEERHARAKAAMARQ